MRAIFAFFWEKRPHMVKFSKLFRKFSPHRQSTLLCSNVVLFALREISKILHYLPDHKNFWLVRRLLLLLGSCPKSARASPEHWAHNWLTRFQISSKLVHFQQSNSQMSEDRFLAHRLFTL